MSGRTVDFFDYEEGSALSTETFAFTETVSYTEPTTVDFATAETASYTEPTTADFVTTATASYTEPTTVDFTTTATASYTESVIYPATTTVFYPDTSPPNLAGTTIGETDETIPFFPTFLVPTEPFSPTQTTWPDVFIRQQIEVTALVVTCFYAIIALFLTCVIAVGYCRHECCKRRQRGADPERGVSRNSSQLCVPKRVCRGSASSRDDVGENRENR